MLRCCHVPTSFVNLCYPGTSSQNYYGYWLELTIIAILRANLCYFSYPGDLSYFANMNCYCLFFDGSRYISLLEVIGLCGFGNLTVKTTSSCSEFEGRNKLTCNELYSPSNSAPTVVEILLTRSIRTEVILTSNLLCITGTRKLIAILQTLDIIFHTKLTSLYLCLPGSMIVFIDTLAVPTTHTKFSLILCNLPSHKFTAYIHTTIHYLYTNNNILHTRLYATGSESTTITTSPQLCGSPLNKITHILLQKNPSSHLKTLYIMSSQLSLLDEIDETEIAEFFEC